MDIDLGGLFKEVEGGYCTYQYVTMGGGGGGGEGGGDRGESGQQYKREQ